MGPWLNMTRVRVGRLPEEAPIQEEPPKKREHERKVEGQNLSAKGPECRIISGLHTFRVSVHYVREKPL